MCKLAEAFVPGKDETDVIIPEREAGLGAHLLQIEAQLDLSKKYGNKKGVFLRIDDGHCVCNFKDWPTFFRLIEQIRLINKVEFIPALVYWSDDRYELAEPLIMDLEIDDIAQEPAEGLLIHVQIDISKRLAHRLGKRIELEYKSKKILRGILEVYDSDGKYGAVRADSAPDLIYFTDPEIESVTWPK